MGGNKNVAPKREGRTMQTQSNRIINSLIVSRMNEIENITGELMCDYREGLEIECIEAMDSNSVGVKHKILCKLNSLIDLLNC
jgi:hypothetical protein